MITSLLVGIAALMAALRDGLAQTILRARVIVILLWVVIVATFAPLGSRIEAELARSVMGASADSARVSELLQENFRSPDARAREV